MINDPPSTNGVEAFWKSILEDDKNHNDNVDWISKHEEMYRNSPEQEWTEISKDEVTAAIRKTRNWKSPGIDNVPNFWLKNCETLHEDIATLVKERDSKKILLGKCKSTFLKQC